MKRKRLTKREAQIRAAAFIAGIKLLWGEETVGHGKRRKKGPRCRKAP